MFKENKHEILRTARGLVHYLGHPRIVTLHSRVDSRYVRLAFHVSPAGYPDQVMLFVPPANQGSTGISLKNTQKIFEMHEYHRCVEANLCEYD